MSLKSFTQLLTIAGTVQGDPGPSSFKLESRSGDVFEVNVGPTTSYQVLTNLDVLGRDRVTKEPPASVPRKDPVAFALAKYVDAGRPLVVSGLYQSDGGADRYEARTVYLVHSDRSRYLFEETHWWLVQVTQMADRILDHLFDAKRSYTIDDFSRFYQTQLNILGQPIDEDVQEMRSALAPDLRPLEAYLMTGAERYLPRGAGGRRITCAQAFRSLSHDGRVLLLGLRRRRNKRARRARRCFRVAGTRRQGDHSALRADLRARRPDASSTASRSTGRCWRTSGARSTRFQD